MMMRTKTTGPFRSARPALFALVALLAACSDDPVQPTPDGELDLRDPWVQVEPAAVGLNQAQLLEALEQAGSIERMRSLLVVRRGALALEWYGGDAHAGTLADVRSVTKSVVSTLTGIALERGDLTGLNQSISTVLRPPDFQLTNDQIAITVEHLLRMSSGFFWDESSTQSYNDWVVSEDPVRYLLDQPFAAFPGDDFTYNSAAVHLLGVMLEEATGQSLESYADQVLFGPLGIEEVEWEQLNGPYPNGGSGIDLRPRDLARLGQLYLQGGRSGGEQIVPEAWVEAATEPYWGDLGPYGPIVELNYGFLWWVDEGHNAYMAWGHGGQFIYVVPDDELVVVVTNQWQGASQDIGVRALTEASMRLIIDYVLPAVQ